MKKYLFLYVISGFCFEALNAQHTRWDWAICNKVCPDTFLHLSDAGSLLALDWKYKAPLYMETDTTGNLYVLGYTPKHPVLTKNPMIFDSYGAKALVDFHYSDNVNVYYYMKLNPAGTLMFITLIASQGIPFPYQTAQPIKLNRNTGDLYLAFAGQSSVYQVWVGDVSPQIPAGSGTAYALVVDKFGNYANRIAVKDAGSATTIRKFLFTESNKTYILADAGKTPPDNNKPARVFVYNSSKDTIESEFKHFSIADYYEIKRGTNRMIGSKMAEYEVDGTQYRPAIPGTALNNIKEVQQVLQKSNGNYVLKVTNLFTGQPYFLELNSSGSIRWAVQQPGVANQLAALDADDQVWIMFENITDSMKALPPGYPTPFVARVDTSKNHTFAETFYPTNISEWSTTTCFTIHKRAKFIAGSFLTQVEFADHFLENTCTYHKLPLQQFIAKAEPGWQQTRKNLASRNIGAENYSIFPNPTSGKIQIESRNQMPQSCMIYDLKGQLKAQIWVPSNGSMDVGFLAAGNYVLVFQKAGNIINRTTLIKQ